SATCREAAADLPSFSGWVASPACRLIIAAENLIGLSWLASCGRAETGSSRRRVSGGGAPRRPPFTKPAATGLPHSDFALGQDCQGVRRAIRCVVALRQQQLRHGEANRLRRPQVDDQLKLGRLLNRKIAQLGTLENFVNIDGDTTIGVGLI